MGKTLSFIAPIDSQQPNPSLGDLLVNLTLNIASLGDSRPASAYHYLRISGRLTDGETMVITRGQLLIAVVGMVQKNTHDTLIYIEVKDERLEGTQPPPRIIPFRAVGTFSPKTRYGNFMEITTSG